MADKDEDNILKQLRERILNVPNPKKWSVSKMIGKAFALIWVWHIAHTHTHIVMLHPRNTGIYHESINNKNTYWLWEPVISALSGQGTMSYRPTWATQWDPLSIKK